VVADIFKERVNELYRDQQTSAAAMAKKAGISTSAMNFYLAGTRRPDIEALQKICSAFGCSADWLLGLTDVRSSSDDVKTAVKNLGIDERFINMITLADHDSRQLFFSLVGTPGFMDILLPEYFEYKVIEGELVVRLVVNTDKSDDKNQIMESGNVVLSKKEAVEYYANKVGRTLAAILEKSVNGFKERIDK